MTKNKYSDIGKKQIIGVINQIIPQIEAIQVTLNMLIKFIDKENTFNDFMKEQLGEINETRTNEHDNIGGDTPKDKSSS
jgi:hypothetical protein